MTSIRGSLRSALVLVLSLDTIYAQFAPGAGEVPGLEPTGRKLFERVEGFTSTAILTLVATVRMGC